jgi:shikimate kinase
MIHHPAKVSFLPPRTIVLVGLMGCGKTSIGRRLARRLELPFYDSDEEIEHAANCKLKDIYSYYGEEEFRTGEFRVIQRLLNQPTHILATGGGSFVTDETRELIQEKAISVWLKADLQTLLARVSRRSDRPILSDGNPEEILSSMIEERYPMYELSDVHVTTLDEPTGATVERVIKSVGDFIRIKYPNYHVLKSI